MMRIGSSVVVRFPLFSQRLQPSSIGKRQDDPDHLDEVPRLFLEFGQDEKIRCSAQV
jgi:hypothetical protein